VVENRTDRRTAEQPAKSVRDDNLHRSANIHVLAMEKFNSFARNLRWWRELKRGVLVAVGDRIACSAGAT
jgi:hypothetical protein